MTIPIVQPMLMSSDVALLADLAAAPPEAHPAAVAVDWERPDERSTWLDRRPTAAQVAALTAVRAVSPWPVVCRVNEVGPGTEDEVEQAIDLGADEVLVPMVRGEAEVERVLAAARGRVGVGIMVETPEAVDRAASLAELGVSRAFVGLLDLAVERAPPRSSPRSPTGRSTGWSTRWRRRPTASAASRTRTAGTPCRPAC